MIDSAGLQTRTVQLRLSGGLQSIDVETRSVSATLASETPTTVADSRGLPVSEVLLMSGANFGDRVPLLNNHGRTGVGDVLGSVSSLRVEGDKLAGRVQFSETATEAFTKVREGHLQDVSVGYMVNQREFVPKGETRQVNGRHFAGPVSVATSWTVREVSVTPIGADSAAKFRSEGFIMNENTNSNVPAAGETGFKGSTLTFSRSDFNDQIRSMCQLTGNEQHIDALIGEGHTSMDEIRKRLHDKKLANRSTAPVSAPVGPYISYGEDQHDKHTGTVRTALVDLVLRNVPEKVKAKLFPKEEQAVGWEQLRGAPLSKLAEECLRADGFSDALRYASKDQMAKAALGFVGASGLQTRGSSGSGYHVTGSFANLTLDASNKSVLAGYMMFPSTWQKVGRTAASVSDFKNINRIRLGDLPNIEVWPGNEPANQLMTRDEKETYAVEAFSNTVSFSWKLLVNDDQDALSRIPQQLGIAMARTVNSTFWSVITSNPTLQDSQALFLETATGNRFRSNLTTGAGTPSVTTLQTQTNKMMQMRGTNVPGSSGQAEADNILGISPKFIVGPSALSTSIKQLVLSAYDPAANTFEVYNTGNELLPVIEPLLDANSTTAWYIVGDPMLWDGVEMTFLQGQEQPVIRNWQEERSLALYYNVLQSFAAKAIDYRSWVKHAGA